MAREFGMQNDTSPSIPLPDRGGEGRRTTQTLECGEGAGGPVAAGDLGDGKERAPVVGQAVEGAGGQGRVAGGEGIEVVGGPAGEFAGEGVFNFGVERVEAGRDLAFLGCDEGYENGAVAQGGRERTDASQRGRSESMEGADGFALAFATISA